MAVFYQEKFVRDIVKDEMQNGIAELLRNATLQGISLRSRGTWVSGREYVNNNQYIDMVYYAKTGCTYTCSATHRSSSIITPDNETYWALMSAKGDNGAGAQSKFISIVFKAYQTKPAKPTGGSFDSPVPEGWSDGIPERTTDTPTIYMSKRKFTSDGVGQDEGWSEPVVAYDSQYTDICFHPATATGDAPEAPQNHGSQGDNLSIWHDTGNPDDVWMAISYRDMRSNGWSDWSISKIKGENGEKGDPGADAQSKFTSIVFIAAPIGVPPSTPSPDEGSFANPVPAGWSDGIPTNQTSANSAIYMSKRIFTSDGKSPQETEWSKPVIAYDSPYIDICFHPAVDGGATPAAPRVHGKQGDTDLTTWHDTGNSNDVWMALSRKDVGSSSWSNWLISKIKGENGLKGDKGDKGDNGDPGKEGQSILVSTVFKASVTQPATPTDGTFDNPVPTGWSDGIPDVSSMRLSVWMSRRKFTSDGIGQDEGWSEPVVACDTVGFDVCFHPATETGDAPEAPTKRGEQGDDITTWHDKGNSNDVWMATCSSSMRDTNPQWSITKIKGENGDTPEFQIDKSSGMLQYRFKNNQFSNLAKVVGDNGKTPALKWEGTKLYIASDGVNFDNGVELKGANGKTPTFQISGKTLQYKFEEDDAYQSLGTVVGNDGKTPTLTWDGTTLLINGDNGVNLQGPKGDTGAQGAAGARGADGARGTRWFTVPKGLFDYSSSNSTTNISFNNILEVQSGIATSSDIQVGDKVKMSVLGYTAEVTSVVKQGIVVRYDGGNIRGAQGAQGAEGSYGLSVEYIGKFKTGVKYLVGDCVTLSNKYENNEFLCTVEHTSSSSEIIDASPTQDGSGNRLSTEYWTLRRANTGSRRSVIDTIIDNYKHE